ncbi:MAG TPA: hypothetical protein VGQ36_16920 [Thermoanaerobaculia bacterium]|jgi:hypothetical protein|nr:hypothetical protein [Thermoanaerobaculia bacterium]
MQKPFVLILMLFLSLSTVVSAQVTCPPGFPAESPVASSSPDDIPPTNIDIITYTGSLAPIRANHNIAYVEITPNDQRVWFGVDSHPGLNRIFYNRRVRANESSPWQWQYSYSPVVITLPAPSSALASSVLYSDTPRYRDPLTNTYYKFLMYLVFQPSSCDGQVAGFMYYAFSDDGICWTTPRAGTRSGGPSFSCHPITNSVPILQMAALDRGTTLTNTLTLVGMEGNLAELVPGDQYLRAAAMDRTQTILGHASRLNPGSVSVDGELSDRGIFQPRGGPVIPGDTWPDRYEPYAYFTNFQIAYDAPSGNFYIGRGYPYPYARYWDYYGSTTPTFSQTNKTELVGPHGPSPVVECAGAPATFPNRIQIYRMNIGSLDNVTNITNPSLSWTKVLDSGGPFGFAFNTWPGGPPPTAQTPLVAGMTNEGRDWASVSFLRDRTGNLIRSGSTGYFFAGDTFKLSKGSNAPCRITGTETNTLRTLTLP